MRKILPFLLALLGGVLPILSLISPMSGLFVLIGYVPLLYAELLLTRHNFSHTNLKVFIAAFLSFSVMNIVALWPFEKLLSYWIILFSLLSAGISALVFLLFSLTKRKLGKIWGYTAWIVFTVALEFLSLNTVFSFPCLLSGVLVFGSGNVSLIQWYEYTGVLGGSVWVLLCNLLFFLLLKKCLDKKTMKGTLKLWGILVACALLPIVFSLYLYYSYEENPDPVEFVVVQPNIDPYTEKFVDDNDRQLERMISLAKQSITSNTEYVVFPETALIGNIWFNNIEENPLVLKIRDSLLVNNPTTKIIAGADMMQYYVVHDGKAPTPWAKKAEDKIYYDFFNVAMQIDSNEVQVYKKSKLVLGTEYVPFVRQFPQLEKLVINLGGSAQSRGRQEKPSLLKSETASVATVICFESIFGEYVSKFIKLGGEVICVISNDGWWEPSPIPQRHFLFAQMRAVENRRAVVRCANTGISGFINQRGDVVATSAWWEPISMKQQVNKNTKLTFYSRHGDYIGWICAGISFVIVLFAIYSFFYRRHRK